MEDEHACNTGLALGIGVGPYVPKCAKKKHVACLNLSFPLHPKEESMDAESRAEGSNSKICDEDEGQANNIIFGNSNNDNSNYNNIDSINMTNCSRKKLRLTKEQITLLEDRFKLHSTLNTAQKQSLAEKLNLRPRQVEVWFQNRRARTKLKQTEVDCEFLKKCCESLSDENMRLKKELQELLSFKHMEQQQQQQQPPFYIHLPKSVAMCPACDKFVKAGGDGTVHNPNTYMDSKN